MKRDLVGRRLVVTGAARGIGERVARVAAARGARLALVGLEADRLRDLADELGNGASWWVADTRDGTALRTAIDGCADHMGGIDLVLANAGVAAHGTVRQADEASFEGPGRHLNGVIRTLKYATPHLERSRGHVMVVASARSFTPLAGLTSYGASKAGVELLTLAYRQEVAHLGITVGLVHPSWIDTDLVRGADADLPSSQGLRRRLPYPATSPRAPTGWPRRSSTASRAARPRLRPARGRGGRLDEGGSELAADLALDAAFRGRSVLILEQEAAALGRNDQLVPGVEAAPVLTTTGQQTNAT